MTPDVQLVACDPKYAALWQTWRHEPSSLRHNPLSQVDTPGLAIRLAACVSEFGSTPASEYRWFVQHAAQIVGTVSINSCNYRMEHAEIGYQIGQRFAGQGLGTQAVAQLLERGFREGPFRRLQAMIHVENVASRRLVERLGFRQEGRLRQHYRIGEKWVDEALYALLRDEWQDRPHPVRSVHHG